MQEQELILGAILRKARDKNRWTQARVAERLRLSVAKIEAIENNDEAIMRSLHGRGYIRSYARLLGLDENELLEQHAQLFPQTKANPIHVTTETMNIANRNKAATKKTLIKLFSLTSLVLLLGVGIWQLRNVSFDFSNQSSPVETSLETSSSDTEKQVLDKEKLVQDVQSEPENADRTGAIANQSGPMQAGQIEIKLVFSEQSWTSIRDRDGKSIYNKLAEAGTQDVIYGTPPVKLIVGNVHGTTVYSHGNQVSMEKFVQNNVARLTLE